MKGFLPCFILTHYITFISLIADDFNIAVGEFALGISPSIEIFLEASNTAVPFNVFNDTNFTNLASFDFGGTFDAKVGVGIDKVPAEIYFTASSDDITNLTAFNFEIGVDIDLDPIKDGEYAYHVVYTFCYQYSLTLPQFPLSNHPSEIIDLLKELKALTYPSWLKNNAQFLPRLDLSCVSKSAIAYLEGNNVAATTAAPSMSSMPSMQPSLSTSPSTSSLPSSPIHPSSNPSLHPSFDPTSQPSTMPSDAPSAPEDVRDTLADCSFVHNADYSHLFYVPNF